MALGQKANHSTRAPLLVQSLKSNFLFRFRPSRFPSLSAFFSRINKIDGWQQTLRQKSKSQKQKCTGEFHESELIKFVSTTNRTAKKSSFADNRSVPVRKPFALPVLPSQNGKIDEIAFTGAKVFLLFFVKIPMCRKMWNESKHVTQFSSFVRPSAQMARWLGE